MRGLVRNCRYLATSRLLEHLLQDDGSIVLLVACAVHERYRLLDSPLAQLIDSRVASQLATITVAELSEFLGVVAEPLA